MSQTILDAAAAFAREVVAPGAARWERDRAVPPGVLRDAASRGLCALLVAREDGGAALGCRDTARVMEILSGACMAFAFGLVVHNNLAGAISRLGTREQKARYLPPMLAGRLVGAFLLTEPDAGSDAAAIATRATRDGNGWVLDGAKAWCSNATTAGVLSVYAQTEPGAGARGIASFLVDADAPGVTREPAYEMLGGHALGAGGFRFDACRVGADAVLAPPGEGFRAAMAGIDLARAVLAAMCCGILDAGLAHALAYARGREMFGRTTADFQGVQWMLADVATDLEAARLLAGAAAGALDAGERATVAAAHAKKFASRAALRGLAECMQVMGAAGLRHDHPLARHLACAKIAAYLDGATEIQNVVIARALLAER